MLCFVSDVNNLRVLIQIKIMACTGTESQIFIEGRQRAIATKIECHKALMFAVLVMDLINVRVPNQFRRMVHTPHTSAICRTV